MVIDPTLMIGIPLFVAFLIPVSGIVSKRWPRALAGVTILFNLVMSILLLDAALRSPVISYLGGWRPPYGIVLYAGPLGSMLALLISTVSMLVWIYAPEYIEGGDREKFYMLYLLLTAGATGMVLTGDLFNLFVFTEITSIASFSLLAYAKGKDEKEAMEATIKYIIIGSLSSAFFLTGIALLYSVTGTLNMANMASRIHNADPRTVTLSMMFIITGLGVEAEMFPLNGWTPDAYTGAAHPVSAIFAGVVVKAGFYAMARVIFSIYASQTALGIFIVFGIMTLIIGESAALRQKDLKRMLAYSSIGQMGLIITAFGIGTQLSLVGGLYALLNHAFAKTLLFMSAGAFILSLGTRDIEALDGMGKRMPLNSLMFTIGAFSIMGLPLFGGFISKIVIIYASVDAGHLFLAILMLSASVIELVYFLRVVQRIWLNEPRDMGKTDVKKASLASVVPMVALAAIVIVMGIYPQAFFKMLGPAAHELLRSIGGA